MQENSKNKTAKLAVERPVQLASDEITVSKIKQSLTTNIGQRITEDDRMALEKFLNETKSFHDLTNWVLGKIVEGTNGIITNQPGNRWNAVEDVTPPEKGED